MSQSEPMDGPRGVLVALPQPEGHQVAVALWDGLRRARPDAQRECWREMSPKVHRLLLRLLGQSGDIEDLVQETFLRFFTRAGRIAEPALVRPFLYGICTRVAREELRRRWVRRWVTLTDKGTLPEIVSQSTDPASDAAEAVRRLDRLVDRLSTADRTLFVLRFVERFDLGEVAEIQLVSLSTARRRLDRLWTRVRRMMAADEVLDRYLDRANLDQEGGHA